MRAPRPRVDGGLLDQLSWINLKPEARGPTPVLEAPPVFPLRYLHPTAKFLLRELDDPEGTSGVYVKL
jgi:hypothetical protein